MNTCTGQSKVHRDARIALLLVLLPNLVLIEEWIRKGRIYKVRVANAPRFAFFLFDPSYTDIDHCCGEFYAWVRSEDWCEYFSDCREGPTISTEMNGACAHVFGTVANKMGRIRIAVTDRSQIELIDCAMCQIPEACAPHP